MADWKTLQPYDPNQMLVKGTLLQMSSSCSTPPGGGGGERCLLIEAPAVGPLLPTKLHLILAYHMCALPRILSWSRAAQ